MIAVTSVYENNTYGSSVNISGNAEEVIIELKTLFEAFIQSEHPEVLHAVIASYLPKITNQLLDGTVSESILSHYTNIVNNKKGGKY